MVALTSSELHFHLSKTMTTAMKMNRVFWRVQRGKIFYICFLRTGHK